MGLSKWARKRVKNWLYPEEDTAKEADYGLPVKANKRRFANKQVITGLSKADDGDAPDFNMHGMTFTMYNANGGTIVEFRGHNKRNDDSVYEIYIINDDSDFTEELAKIIGMCRLRQL